MVTYEALLRAKRQDFKEGRVLVPNDFLDQLRTIYEQYRTELYVFALSITRCSQSAEDAVHEAFRKVMGKGSAPEGLRPYLFRCVRNAALDELRSLKRTGRRDSIFASAQESGSTPAALSASEMDEFLERLSADERECIVLKMYSGLSFKEIAETKRASPNTVASWYRRGLQKLRAHLEEVKT